MVVVVVAGNQADELGVALNAVMTATDRVDAYGSLLNACKNIAQGTCYLLILVYGGRVKCILLKAEEVKKQIAEVCDRLLVFFLFVFVWVLLVFCCCLLVLLLVLMLVLLLVLLVVCWWFAGAVVPNRLFFFE